LYLYQLGRLAIHGMYPRSKQAGANSRYFDGLSQTDENKMDLSAHRHFFRRNRGVRSYFLHVLLFSQEIKKTLLILSNLNAPIVMGLKTKNQ
jgi:hypothetical protein